MHDAILRLTAASLAFALMVLLESCGKDTINVSLPVPLPPPSPILNCDVNSVALRCEGYLTIPPVGAPGLSVTLQCVVPNNYLDTLLAKGLWVDSIQSINSATCSIRPIGFITQEYGCGSFESPSTCFESTLINIPELTQVKLRFINPLSPVQKIEIGQWTTGTNIGLDQFDLYPVDLKPYIYPNPPINNFVLEVEFTVAEPVGMNCPVVINLGFCMNKN